MWLCVAFYQADVCIDLLSNVNSVEVTKGDNLKLTEDAGMSNMEPRL